MRDDLGARLLSPEPAVILGNPGLSITASFKPPSYNIRFQDLQDHGEEVTGTISLQDASFESHHVKGENSLDMLVEQSMNPG